MARQVLGALTTLNLSTNLDPMFSELYDLWNRIGYTGHALTVPDAIEIGTAGTIGAATRGRLFACSNSASVPGVVVQGAGPSQGVIGFGTTTNGYQIQGGADYSAINLIAAGTTVLVAGGGSVRPGADNSLSCGASAMRWSVVYAGTGTINTSDAREKTKVDALDQQEIAASIALGKEIGGFKFLSAIKDKGDGARRHIGMTVQRAMEVMESFGLDPLRYAFICHDSWDEVKAPEEKDEDGKVTKEATTTPAGDRYGFRVDELSLFIMRGLVARLDALEA